MNLCSQIVCSTALDGETQESVSISAVADLDMVSYFFIDWWVQGEGRLDKMKK